MSRAFRSVRSRTTLVAAGVFGIAFVFAAFALVRVVDNRVHDAAAGATRTALVSIRQQILNNTPMDQLQSSLSQPVYFQVFNANGTLVAGNLANPPIVRTVAGHRVYHVPGRGSPVVTTERVVADGRVLGTVMVASSLENADRSVATLRRWLWFVTPFLIGLVALIVWVLVGRALHPVESIRQEVEAISLTTIDRRVPVPDTDDEIARLASTMNAMLNRLDRAQARQREFVSDASHELRSPIASMRTELEVALAHPSLTEWPLVAERVLAERDRLERLVDDLLELARLEEGRPLRRDELDLDDIVFSDATRSRRVPVNTSAVTARRVVGDARALEQVVRNLLDNAARHARSRVAVSLTPHDGVVTLTVDDDGGGIAAGERERIFERFTRVDGGRGREDGGAGLGLSLVRRVVEAHAGSIRCAESPFGGARFEVVLPAVT